MKNIRSLSHANSDFARDKMEQICVSGNLLMFAIVRLLLLALIVLAVVLFIQPNLLKEQGLQLPEEETGVTTAPEVIEEKDREPETTEPKEGAITESMPANADQVPDDSQAVSPEPAATALPVANQEQETPADTPEPTPAIGEEAETAAVAAPVDELAPPSEALETGDTPQQLPATTEPAASEESISEGMTGISEEMGNALRPDELPGENLTDTPDPVSPNMDVPPASESQLAPSFAEEAEIPVEPADAEEPASPAETLEEPGDEQPPADGTAPTGSTGEAEEIPTAGSPELQRVLENIDRTFNN
jgi:hypothetical protein